MLDDLCDRYLLVEIHKLYCIWEIGDANMPHFTVIVQD